MGTQFISILMVLFAAPATCTEGVQRFADVWNLTFADTIVYF
jgi:hypothetical protein